MNRGETQRTNPAAAIRTPAATSAASAPVPGARTATSAASAPVPGARTATSAASASALIKTHALALGFDLCRITSAAPPASGNRFEAWLEAGHHGTMEYLARNAARRLDPNLVLPGSRSVICLAVSYHHKAPSPTAATTTTTTTIGRIARYSRFADYHEIVGAKLRELAAFVDAHGEPGTRSLAYVDTGPVLERDLAQRAGLGFIGKHTNLISRDLGNWFFLAEILTTAQLDPDPPEPNRCGSCTRCLSACPTGALVEPFVLDARRCIAFLTIELKGSIPVEWRPALGTRIFGCDDCLEACPWNRFAREANLMRAHVRDDLELPDLVELLSLDDAAFRSRFRGTPIARAKRRGLLRNVAVALGNLGDPAALPALERAAQDAEPLVAEHASWAIPKCSSGVSPQINT